jgi:hypothetical protein
VRWCGLCLEPIREFHPRPATETPFVGTPSHMVRTSRWRASDLTFGPRGRLAVTPIVFIVLFVGESSAGWISPFGLWFFMGWFILATMVLKTTWQKVRIDPTSPRDGGRSWPSGSRGSVGTVSGSVVGLVVAVLAVTVAIVAYWKVDQLGRFGILVLGVMTAVSVTLIWLTGV